MDMLWSGWGDPAKAAPLPDAVTGLLRDLLGVTPRGGGAPPPRPPRPPPPPPPPPRPP
ncbi:FAD-binding oxidoreductase, partial [Streptomyces sp. NPDC059762]